MTRSETTRRAIPRDDLPPAPLRPERWRRSNRRGASRANDTLTVGCLGTGGRCQTLMKSLAQVPGSGSRPSATSTTLTSNGAKKLADPKAFATKHYREILDRKDIDAVLIGSPDHWHVPMAVDACNAGKDVYVEKPLTHDLAEGAAIIEAQNRNQQDRPGRHAAAEHAAHPESARAGRRAAGSARSSRST